MYILTVHSSYLVNAKKEFGDLGVEVVTGQRFLGGYIGDWQSTERFINQKDHFGADSIKILSQAGGS